MLQVSFKTILRTWTNVTISSRNKYQSNFPKSFIRFTRTKSSTLGKLFSAESAKSFSFLWLRIINYISALVALCLVPYTIHSLNFFYAFHSARLIIKKKKLFLYSTLDLFSPHTTQYNKRGNFIFLKFFSFYPRQSLQFCGNAKNLILLVFSFLLWVEK
jgi:hypothetical protein